MDSSYYIGPVAQWQEQRAVNPPSSDFRRFKSCPAHEARLKRGAFSFYDALVSQLARGPAFTRCDPGSIPGEGT